MSSEENKKVARVYHDLNPDDVETILTPDFIGRHPTGFTWNRDNHKNYVANKLEDTIHEQFAEGDWVATRFTRTWMEQDKPMKLDAMHMKRFVDGKITEIWEYFDSKQLEQ
jgi:ketosteroid isomerase-like protein